VVHLHLDKEGILAEGIQEGMVEVQLASHIILQVMEVVHLQAATLDLSTQALALHLDPADHQDLDLGDILAVAILLVAHLVAATHLEVLEAIHLDHKTAFQVDLDILQVLVVHHLGL